MTFIDSRSTAMGDMRSQLCEPDEVDFVTPGLDDEYQIADASRRITEALMIVPVIDRLPVLQKLSALALEAEETVKRHG